MHNIHKVDSYNHQLEEIRTKFPILDIAISELEPTLRRDPRIYPAVIGKEIYRIMVNSPDMPSISIFFRYDETTVYLLREEQLEAED